MTRKIALLIAILVIGGGALAVNMMSQPEQQASAYIIADKTQPEAKKTTGDETNAESSAVDFLNYDMVIGDSNAPIEIIEYAAISCPHCAHFHDDVLPKLKKKFLDTGKAKLIYRNFIFDNPFDVFASALTRCVTDEEFFPTLKTYFDNQAVWNKLPDLRRIYKADGREAAIKFAQGEVARTGEISGISLEDAQKCFDNQAVVDYLLKIRRDAFDAYEVNSTPTLIVNGKKLEGNDMASLEKAIEAAENKVTDK